MKISKNTYCSFAKLARHILIMKYVSPKCTHFRLWRMAKTQCDPSNRFGNRGCVHIYKAYSTDCIKVHPKFANLFAHICEFIIYLQIFILIRMYMQICERICILLVYTCKQFAKFANGCTHPQFVLYMYHRKEIKIIIYENHHGVVPHSWF